jgi:2,4-dienoyl-CoA reductase-like NADH-dependent reductase (Old Yellow Enzyme family)
LKLFEPLTIGKVIIENRIVLAPCDTNYATDEGCPSERLIDHYSRIAEGGAGLIIVENTNVNPEPRAKARQSRLCLHDDRFIAPLAKLAEKIHAQGARAALQLVDMSLRAASRKPADLPIAEIHQLVRYFADAADRGRKAGFDAVEFHMAHSYTLADFLSKRGNNRRDEYGGDLEGRMKLPLAVLKSSRERVGKEYLLMCRIDGDEFIAGGNTLLHCAAIAKKLGCEGADLIDVSAGLRRDDGSDTYSVLRGIPSADFPDGCNVHLAEAIRKEVNVPVITVGKIRRPPLMEEILQKEKADLVAMARPLIADPFLPEKIKEGRPEDIVNCLSCNACHALVMKGRPLECAQWRKTGKGA